MLDTLWAWETHFSRLFFGIFGCIFAHSWPTNDKKVSKKRISSLIFARFQRFWDRIPSNVRLVKTVKFWPKSARYPVGMGDPLFKTIFWPFQMRFCSSLTYKRQKGVQKANIESNFCEISEIFKLKSIKCMVEIPQTYHYIFMISVFLTQKKLVMRLNEQLTSFWVHKINFWTKRAFYIWIAFLSFSV